MAILTVDMKMNLISRKRNLKVWREFLRLAGFVSAMPWAAAFGAANDTPDIRRDATVVAVEQVMPGVVNIATRSVVPVSDPFERFYREIWHQKPFDEYYSLGSGVVIDEAGYLLTNDHVIRRASQIAVRFGTGTNEYEATLVVSDAKTDVALLKLKARPGEKFHTIKLAREDDLLLGETVLALGNPYGLGGSVTRGILSSKSRLTLKEGDPLVIQNCLQTDAAINPGNSGGPLVNLRGELIGINVQYVPEAQNIGFAIPIKLVMNSLSEIFPTECVRSFWFGARVRVGSNPLVVSSVQPESPAGRAGLNIGDAIMRVNGKEPRSFIDFGDLLASGADADVTISVRRDAGLSNVVVRLVPETTKFNAALVLDKLGLELAKTDDGFVIVAVQPGSPAAGAGLKKGMLVRAVDGQSPPADVTGMAKLIYGKKKGEPVRLDIVMLERGPNFNVLHQGVVELVPR
jgi:S1-C subfamily serine protease